MQETRAQPRPASADCHSPGATRAAAAARRRGRRRRAERLRTGPASPGAVRRRERAAGVEQPQLGRVDLVPVRSLALLEQEQDRGGRGATARRRLRPPGLAIPAAFRMGGEPEPVDQAPRPNHGLALPIPG